MVDPPGRNESRKKRRKRIPKDSSTMEKRSAPFAGKLFVVSTLVQTSNSSEGDSYKGLLALCESGGARCSSQVHKKVHCVVATTSAIQGETQRVRKAWKKGIPVLKADWVRQCLQVGRLIPFDDDLVPAPLVHKKEPKGAKSESRTASIIENERKVELGCCCVCHDTGATDCEWCIECDVTKRALTDTGEQVAR